MRYNKTLGVAIAAVLSGGIGLAAHAGNLTGYTTSSPYTALYTVVEVPTETTDSKGNPASSGILAGIETLFEFKREAPVQYGINLRFTLTGAEFVTTEFVWKNGATGQNTAATVNPVLGGNGESYITYLLGGDSANSIVIDDKTDNLVNGTSEDTAYFKFTVTDTIGLADAGGTVKLEAEWGAAPAYGSPLIVDDSGSMTLFKSASKVDVAFNYKELAAKIDVTKGGKKFVDGYSETTITLGTVEVTDNTSSKTIINSSSTVTGSLYIEGGPFLASTDNAGGKVFLNVNGTPSCGFTEDTGSNDGDPVAVLDDDKATFNLEREHVAAMEGKKVDVCVIVSDTNETDINPTKQRAVAYLTLKYSDKDITSSGKLARIKRNGTACTLYNVPHKNASDYGFYRFINKNNTDAMVLGSLRDRDGVVHLKDQELGTAPAKGTLVVTAAQLHDFAVAQTGADTEKPWLGRAVLSINSNSTDMEAYALLRAKNTQNVVMGGVTPGNMGPLINVSAGASGNGCND